MQNKIIVVDANVSLKPYLQSAKNTLGFEAQLEKMGFEVQEFEEKPKRKIGFLASMSEKHS